MKSVSRSGAQLRQKYFSSSSSILRTKNLSYKNMTRSRPILKDPVLCMPVLYHDIKCLVTAGRYLYFPTIDWSQATGVRGRTGGMTIGNTR